jgi:UDP-glucose-4-epimerase GalE
VPPQTSAKLAGPVLVVGGAGYIGSITVRALRAAGVATVVFDNLSTGHRRAAQGPLELGDLSDRTALTLVFARHRPTAVIHFAAKTYVGESVQDPAAYYFNNVACTWNLLEAMRAGGVRDIVFSSTCATYGVPTRIPITEEHPQAPISPYGRTKLHMEHMLEDYSRAYGLRFAALRYFNAAGATQDGELGEWHEPETHLIPLVLQAAAGLRQEIAVFGRDYDTPDGTCIRDYIHVEDLARAHLLALARLQAGAERLFLNLGTGSGYSVQQVIDVARAVTSRPIQVREAPRRAGDPPRLVGSGERAARELGWCAERPDLRDIVADAWQFLTRHPRGYPRD